MPHKILVVDDDAVQRKMISVLLKNKLSMNAIEASSSVEALDLLRQDDTQSIKLVLADHIMPGIDGLELLQMLGEQYPELPVIMLTGSTDVRVAVEAMRRGAKDFLSKPPEPERLRVSILNALKLSVLEKEVTRLTRNETGTFSFDNLIGRDEGLRQIIKVGKKAALADIPVLLLGETGVGKEVFAKAIHGESRRVGKPFIPVNCGAIPEQLVESTLFGHEKGAFTGAIAKSIGRFREAEGGTIFLDEVGELPLDAQVKLLRVLQQKEITPVGGGKPINVNVRVISATNRNLEEEVAAGRFREDLYFRLNVLPIHLPPLRERKGDIPALVKHFIERFAASERLPLKDISAEAMGELVSRNWSGNARELENTIHRAVVLSEKNILDKEDFTNLGEKSHIDALLAATKDISAGVDLMNAATGRLKTMDEIERDAMQLALRLADNNITKAAEMLGIAKSTFYRKIK
jgi:DNA-binding NtrC family response regulator